MQNFFKYSWKVNLLFLPGWFFLYSAFHLGFSNWFDGIINKNDLYLLGYVIGMFIFFLLTRRQAIKEFNKQYSPPEKE
ncbi:hypothetical protein BSG1_04955 [Bacillus sp. SG-1]|nr:hypothetical protein BSG1_04955 [Bacillus sp. SG-1]